MSNSQSYMGTPNGVVLCVDQKRDGHFCGSLYHAYSGKPTEFISLDEMPFQMEKLYDFLNFPHPTTNDRTFSEGTRKKHIVQERNRIMSDEELLSKHGDLGTFIIRVQHRQNSSWQGRITWVEKDKTVYFRSVWELIKLVEGALDTVSEQEELGGEVFWHEDKKESE